MNAPQGSVFIVDDAREIRAALTCMLDVAGYQVYAFDSAERYLEAQECEVPGCLLLDIGLPGMSGIDLQRALVGSKSARPIIFLTGQGDVNSSVEAMKLGAVDFLTKPVDDTRLFAAVDRALRHDANARCERAICDTARLRLQLLTRCDRRVMEFVIRGRLNKQIAAELGIAEKTVKLHRYRVMRKMNVPSVPSLMRLVAHAGIQPEFSTIGKPVARSASGEYSRFEARGRHLSLDVKQLIPACLSERSRS